MTQSQVEIAKAMAEKAHAGQRDKAGKPYIEHPAYVAAQVQGEEAKAIAWLHDVVEDTSITFEDLLSAGISAQVVDALRLLTHDKSVPYLDYIRALKRNPLARMVKLADLRHNSDLSRLSKVTSADEERLAKYQKAIQTLES